jgi:hypothetical protein
MSEKSAGWLFNVKASALHQINGPTLAKNTSPQNKTLNAQMKEIATQQATARTSAPEKLAL